MWRILDEVSSRERKIMPLGQNRKSHCVSISSTCSSGVGLFEYRDTDTWWTCAEDVMARVTMRMLIAWLTGVSPYEPI